MKMIIVFFLYQKKVEMISVFQILSKLINLFINNESNLKQINSTKI
jgi:hypothetical protein